MPLILGSIFDILPVWGLSSAPKTVPKMTHLIRRTIPVILGQPNQLAVHTHVVAVVRNVANQRRMLA
jgi:hypothetical protein